MTITLANSIPMIPEMFIALAAMLILLVGIIIIPRSSEATAEQKQAIDKKTTMLYNSGVLSLGIALYLVINIKSITVITFNGLFYVDPTTYVIKIILLSLGFLMLATTREALRDRGILSYEYMVLMLLSITGMMISISAYDLLSLYVGMELQALSLYIIIAMMKKNTQAIEASLKYYILGALATAIFIYGSSFIYGMTGTTNFKGISLALAGSHAAPEALTILGLVLIIIAIGFKFSAVPFHMWTPDVYKGTPAPILAVIGTLPKVVAVAITIRLLWDVFGSYAESWNQILWLLAALSMIVGAVVAVYKDNIKSILAYSAIANGGYMLMGYGMISAEMLVYLIVYVMVYSISIGMIVVILSHIKKDGRPVETINDIAGLLKVSPTAALILAISIFSIMGLPPMAGFFTKLSIFLGVIKGKEYILSSIGILAAVIAGFYYLRIIKAMLIDSAADGVLTIEWGTETKTASVIVGLLTLGYMGLQGLFVEELLGIVSLLPYVNP